MQNDTAIDLTCACMQATLWMLDKQVGFDNFFI